MNKSYLLIGGNTGDRKNYLQQAVNHIKKMAGSVAGLSHLYETAAWGKTDQPAFLNQAIELHTSLKAPDLMKELLSIEEIMGRKRMEKYGPRIIDIDILLFNNEILQTSFLTLPHPELPNRRFALEPLAEIAPGAVHPVLHKTIKQLLLECKDTLEVKKI